ncbi:PEP-CTERM sorting domain-containing protein [Thalassomonas sp. RHCl1]|uniref:PEP-CTERM sorting domain-containing protein n=1 Tax=Thalassomonas sp. RHCl1 TaxID=2995320 RepID=UPI00248BBA39|nr:PEP-CTERM sorting domain-containing protein [Thalassomonas sp. RHCl1]
MMYKNLLKGLVSGLVLSTAVSANASQILFAHVNTGNYVADGNGLAAMLSAAGHDVTTRFLNDAVYDDYSSFDQIFVYDLSVGADNSAIQNANYANIGNWYNNLTEQNLILDGRMISSYASWTNANNMSAEDAWMQNYAHQLDLRGGGLVLGTDHNVFASGINNINNAIGVSGFYGSYGSYPSSQAVVDVNSPLYLDSLDTCRSDSSSGCINDNSTTGFVATGLQANGQMLTPVAYHGSNLDAWNYAAVSSTMGSETFGTCGGADQPPCSVPAPGSLALFGLGIAALGFARRKRA